MPDFSQYDDPIAAELDYLRKRSEALQAEMARTPGEPRPALDEEMRRLRERLRHLMARS